MEKLPEHVVEFILHQINQGNFQVTGTQIIIDIVKKELPKNIYKLKSGRYNVKIHCPETQKKVNIGTFDTVEEAIRAKNEYLGMSEKETIINLNKFRNR